MVQQQVEKQDFPILDETSAEQVAIEEKVMAGEPIVQPEVAAPEVVETQTASETTPAVPAVAAATPAAPVEEKPVQRVYTDEQVRQMQSSWDRQISQERQRAAASERRLQEFDLNASVEAHLRTQERQLEPSVGADEARKAVRTPENERQARETVSAQQQVRVLTEQQRATGAEQEFNAMLVVAQGFVQRYGVPAEDAELLLTAPTPVQMEKLAQRLGVKATTKTALKGQVPVETSKTQLESGMSGTTAPESLDRMAQRLNTKPSWEWTPREVEFMRTGR